jgi:hypothetical protein
MIIMYHSYYLLLLCITNYYFYGYFFFIVYVYLLFIIYYYCYYVYYYYYLIIIVCYYYLLLSFIIVLFGLLYIYTCDILCVLKKGHDLRIFLVNPRFSLYRHFDRFFPVASGATRPGWHVQKAMQKPWNNVDIQKPPNPCSSPHPKLNK